MHINNTLFPHTIVKSALLWQKEVTKVSFLVKQKMCLQCCVTRVGTRTRVLFTRTRTRVQFFALWHGIGLGLGNRDSRLGPESRPSPSSSGRAVLRCLLWHSIHFVVVFHVLEDKQILNNYVDYYIDSWIGLDFFVWLGLADSDSDLDSDLTTWTRTQHWSVSLTSIEYQDVLPNISLSRMSVCAQNLDWQKGTLGKIWKH